jgi:hypothetical protein
MVPRCLGIAQFTKVYVVIQRCEELPVGLAQDLSRPTEGNRIMIKERDGFSLVFPNFFQRCLDVDNYSFDAVLNRVNFETAVIVPVNGVLFFPMTRHFYVQLFKLG